MATQSRHTVTNTSLSGTTTSNEAPKPDGAAPAATDAPVKPEDAGKEDVKQEAVESTPAAAKGGSNEGGMSATSGPLDDNPELSHAAETTS
jgi:hypothetical protein